MHFPQKPFYLGGVSPLETAPYGLVASVPPAPEKQGGVSLPLATATSRSANAVSGKQTKQKKRQYPRTCACRSAYTPIANTAPSTGSGNTFDYAQGAVVTLSLTQGLYRNKIPVFKTSHFQHLLHFVVSSATPSAGSNAARNACSDWVVLT